ncbi:MAG: ATP synthase F1 subunit gamma [Thermodesulfovibrionales bacterium]|nr:ATP synthase F1 subunit gamma [Thermodesulfovibrionales bacterium]
MPGLKEIRKRINSVKSTKQITKAMKMVAAAKFRKAQTRITELKPYAEKMETVLASLSSSVGSGHPLLEARPIKAVEVVTITGDRGLCGAFNTNVMKVALKTIKELEGKGYKVTVSSIGKKGVDLFKRREISLRKSWIGLSGKVSYAVAQEIAKDFTTNFIEGNFDELILVFNEFKSAVVQRVKTFQLLPMAPIKDEGQVTDTIDFIYEPNQQAIFESLVPKNVEIQIFRALLDSQAAEEAARMTAMENATKAANDMISRLTLKYNKARQESITKELMDIVGGVEALKH